MQPDPTPNELALPRSDCAHFPVLPQGALLYSALAAFHAQSANHDVATTVKQFGGRTKTTYKADVLGADLRNLSLPWEPVSFFRDQLIDGSVLCFYMHFVSNHEAEIYRDQILKGEKRTRYLSRPMSPRLRVAPFASASLRFCPLCAELDCTQYGLPHWRVVHQLPGVHHCPVHSVPLHGHCMACPPMKRGPRPAGDHSWSLPGENCTTCGGVHFKTVQIPQSKAYDLYLDYCSRLVIGDPELSEMFRPEYGDLIYGKYIRSLRDTSPYAIKEIVLKSWGFDSTIELSRALESEFDETFIYHAITGTEYQRNASAHLILRCALQADLSSDSLETYQSYEHEDPLAHLLSIHFPQQSVYLIDLLFHGRQNFLPDDTSLAVLLGAPLKIAAQGVHYYQATKERIEVFGQPRATLMSRLRSLQKLVKIRFISVTFERSTFHALVDFLQEHHPELHGQYSPDASMLCDLSYRPRRIKYMNE